ncbi:methionine sulfoxide reductase B [Nonlabens sp. MIC269]|uniref:peptide-methionine (R)-S-oxide reductase MsrB n=1 Tax=Nonlabens TaxID=363408 RepID=UPI00071FCBDC|nr:MULTISPECIES: peptide-methionine (R)-S-oxide reductase MsrB [Nonlabens]ALM20024.1 methionine sulfoxide reductase B [Nonlabens sp. MIC269]ARN70937.1 peptide-methionine (R)-S-oxide reductase [Nonlabens tegetincola]MEE2801245.1 peptide-methionine (R)-S-oxide reductase MsrB [Bacteroidota bacterium]
MKKTEAEWKEELTPEQYYILREKGTERPFSGEYNTHFEKGMYVCAACNNPLFKSETKFDSGCGWPSFDGEIPGAIERKLDKSHGMIRTEILCSNCGGHLGHVFNDGPTASGIRHCVNSISIDFKSSQ